MLKRLICLLIAAVLAMSAVSVTAFAAPEDLPPDDAAAEGTPRTTEELIGFLVSLFAGSESTDDEAGESAWTIEALIAYLMPFFAGSESTEDEAGESTWTIEALIGFLEELFESAEATNDEAESSPDTEPDEDGILPIFYLPGDVNADGSVNNRDAMILDRYVAGWADYDRFAADLRAADVSFDGQVNNRDAMILDRYVAGWAWYDLVGTWFNGDGEE